MKECSVVRDLATRIAGRRVVASISGGKQLELFAAPKSERGCMRWGLCDTHGDEVGR